ncbi:MAG TPA: hypothetical protein VHB48_03160 [Chitinophagaceae bacterium]|nr:hypothetical protein [Chitinophagaceae bacterium]
MKPQYYIVKTFIVFTACLCFFNSCKKYNQDITWRINTNVYSSPTLIRFLNSDPAATEEPKDFKVTISGRDANKVVVESGGTEFKAVGGLLPLALVGGVTPTPENPVIFNVYADIPGYAPVSQAIILTDTAPSVRSVFAVSYANPVKGTSAFSKSSSLSGGVSGAVTFSTQTNADMTEKATITIQDGTQMLDADGNVINSSNLQTKVIHFGTGTTSSLESFPGGLTAPDALDKNGSPIEGGVTFVTGGLLSIRMLAGGIDVKKFSKPLNVTMEMNSNVINPGTNQSVKAGDSIPVWSLNEQTGQWKCEAMGYVTLDKNGKPSVEFQAAHLSCWNLDWSWQQFGSYKTCNNSLRVIIHADPSYCAGNFEVTLETKNNQYLGALHGTPLYNGFECVFAQTPVIDEAKIVITNNGNGKVVAESVLFTPCSQGVIEVDLGVPPVPDVVAINLNVKGKCTNLNAAFGISGWFYFYFAAAGPLDDQKVLVHVTNGAGTLKLVNGANYIIQVCYDQQNYVAAGTFNKENFVFTPIVYGKYALTGTGAFDAVANALNLDFNLATSCNN